MGRSVTTAGKLVMMLIAKPLADQFDFDSDIEVFPIPISR